MTAIQREYKAAHVATRKAIRDGVLVRKPCEVCRKKKTEAHHDDYGKPLEVRWLCRAHHMQIHGREKKLRNASASSRSNGFRG
jgi:hypothetical protein